MLKVLVICIHICMLPTSGHKSSLWPLRYKHPPRQQLSRGLTFWFGDGVTAVFFENILGINPLATRVTFHSYERDFLLVLPTSLFYMYLFWIYRYIHLSNGRAFLPLLFLKQLSIWLILTQLCESAGIDSEMKGPPRPHSTASVH